MRARVLFLTLGATIAAACGGSSSGPPNCQAGSFLCGNACVKYTETPNCGACGNACTSDQECRAQDSGVFACLPNCVSQLVSRYDNPESGSWDGANRETLATNYDAARSNCANHGGRLPTATELARLSRDTGTPAKTGALWSLTADGPERRFTVDIATGAAAVVATSTTAFYRCLCPPPAPATFSGAACFGPPGAAQCSTPGDGPAAYDATDRLALTKAGAIWECAFAGAHLPTPAQIAEATSLTPKLSGGSNQQLHSADDASYDRDAVVKFGTAFDVSQDLTSVLRPFRCVGIPAAANLPATPLASTVYLAHRGGLQADLHDAATNLVFGDAVSACWNSGGHLATATELAALVTDGLPNGSGNPLWAADTQYADGSGWHTPSYKWSGGPITPGYDPGAATWVYTLIKADTTAHPYRCVYYPLLAGYAGPAVTDCQGGCSHFEKPMAGSTALSASWIDLEDRAAATFTTAAADCASQGAHLPSMRDYTEVIRAGLSGANTALWTGDFVYPAGAYAVIWTGGSNGTFNGASTGAATAITTPTKYRCMWTNELR